MLKQHQNYMSQLLILVAGYYLQSTTYVVGVSATLIKPPQGCMTSLSEGLLTLSVSFRSI